MQAPISPLFVDVSFLCQNKVLMSEVSKHTFIALLELLCDHLEVFLMDFIER